MRPLDGGGALLTLAPGGTSAESLLPSLPARRVVRVGSTAAALTARVEFGEETPAGAIGIAARLARALPGDLVLLPVHVVKGSTNVRGILRTDVARRVARDALEGALRGAGADEIRGPAFTPFEPRRFAAAARVPLSPPVEALLRRAFALGYYDSPRRCTLADLGATMSLTASPVHKRLVTAEHAVLAARLTDGTPPSTATRAMEAAPGPVSGPIVELAWSLSGEDAPVARAAREAPAVAVAVPVATERGDGRTFLVVGLGPQGAQHAFASAVSNGPRAPHVERLSAETGVITLKVVMHGAAPPPFGAPCVVLPSLYEGGTSRHRALVIPPNGGFDPRSCVARLARAIRARESAVTMTHVHPFDPALSVGAHDRLTPRQEQVLRVAHALGYYRTPRASTVAGLARTLGVSANAIHKNLVAGERKTIAGHVSGSPF